MGTGGGAGRRSCSAFLDKGEAKVEIGHQPLVGPQPRPVALPAPLAAASLTARRVGIGKRGELERPHPMASSQAHQRFAVAEELGAQVRLRARRDRILQREEQWRAELRAKRRVAASTGHQAQQQ